MAEMKPKIRPDFRDLPDDLILNPESLYSTPGLEPEKILAVEEFFALIKYAGLNSLSATSLADEEVALGVDQMLAGKAEATLSHSSAAVYSDLHAMEKGGRAKLPLALRNVVATTLAGPVEKTAAPALLVRMMQDTIQVIKSSFQNVSLQNSEALAVRSSAATAPRERTDKFELRQVVSVDLTIFYEILRENGNAVLLRVHLEPEPAFCRVNLLQNNRIVTSLNYVRGENGITFQRLSPGSYRIEIKGDDWDFATGIVIDAQ